MNIAPETETKKEKYYGEKGALEIRRL